MFLVGKPEDVSFETWGDNIKMDIKQIGNGGVKLIFIYLRQNTVQRRVLVNTQLNFGAIKSGNLTR
jgi:hypothetical protein